jgi:hypothetical protein
MPIVSKKVFFFEKITSQGSNQNKGRSGSSEVFDFYFITNALPKFPETPNYHFSDPVTVLFSGILSFLFAL